MTTQQIERMKLLVEKGYIEETYLQTPHTKTEFENRLAIADLLYAGNESIPDLDIYFSTKSNFIDLPSDKFYQINRLLCKLSFHVSNSNIYIVSGVLNIVQHHISRLIRESGHSEHSGHSESSGHSGHYKSSEHSGHSKSSGHSESSEQSESVDFSSFDETTNNKINYLKKIKRQFFTAVIIIKQNIKLSPIDTEKVFGEDFYKYINLDTIDYIIDVSKIIVDFIENFN